MNCKKLVFAALCAAGLVVSVQAADVSFTGDAGDRDLSKPANWGGALPSGSDVGVVNTSTFGASYTVGSDATISGLKFEKGTAALTLAGPATLTLGAGGLVVSNATKVTLSGPLATSAAQTWIFGSLPVESYARIAGTAALTMKSWTTFKWYNAPRYGGDLTMSGGTGYIDGVDVFESAQWANTVKVTGPICFQLTNTVTLSTLCPGRSIVKRGWTLGYMIQRTGYPLGGLVVEDGDTFDMGGDSVNWFCHDGGSLIQNGGTFIGANQTQQGPVAGAGRGDSVTPTTWVINGGTADFRWFNLGLRAYTNRIVRQTGGAVTSSGFRVGGFPASDLTPSIVKYLMSGGTATASHEFSLGSMVSGGANALTQPGVFQMTGGTANFPNVRFGASYNEYGGDPTGRANGRSYGLLELNGGTFNLPTSGIELRSDWNAGAYSNSTYDVRLGGGKLAMKGDTELKVAMTVTGDRDVSTVATAGYRTRLSGPLDGNGELCKTGVGKLMLTDATRFRGRLDVAEGSVALMGVVTEPEHAAAGGDYFEWTADSLAATLADGDTVTSWADSTGTVAARQMASGDVSQPATYGVPTFKTAVANGHAGVKFLQSSKQALAFPAASNPLCGATNYSVAVVFVPTMAGQGSEKGGNSYAGRMVIGNFHSWRGVPNYIGLTLDYDNRLYAETKFSNGSTAVATVAAYAPGTFVTSTPTPYVAVLTRNGNKMILNFDNGFTNKTAVAAAGGVYPAFYDTSSKTRHPLYLGTSDVDAAAASNARCFDGYINEVRIYRDRALSDAEQRSLVQRLVAKYRGDSAADTLAKKETGPVLSVCADSRTVPALPTPDTTWEPATVATFSVPTGCTMPELVPNAINGKPALRFDAAKLTAVNLVENTTSADPIANAKPYSLAFVFRTKTAGTGLNDATVGTGLYSCMLAGRGHFSGCSNASISFREDSGIGGYHTYSATIFTNMKRPCHLNDGQPHVVVVSADLKGGGGTYSVMVDGVPSDHAYDGKETANWPGYDSGRPHVIGALRAGTGHFTGDLATFRFWRRQLTKDEMTAVSLNYASEYRFNLKERRAFTCAGQTTRGLSATNVNVAAGATFTAPMSKTTPLTLGAGQTLTGAGTFAGSYRFGEGAVIDTAAFPADVEDVQIAGGATIVFKPGSTPFVCPGLSSVTGTVTLDVSALDQEGASRVPLLTVPQSVLAGATFELVGAKRGATVVYNVKKGCLELKLLRGLMLIVR